MKHSKSRFWQALTAASLLLVATSPLLRASATDPEPSYNQETAKLTGTYTGEFGKSKITVCLEKLVGSTVIGYSVVAGNERAFSGSYKEKEGVLEVVAREPGDDEADGEFNFTVNPTDKRLAGTWKQFKKKRAVEFDLAKRDFKYDPKAGDYPETSTKILKEADVENIAAKELRVMRNEIYARHGYSFKLDDMRKHFDPLDWYMPMTTEVSSQLTDIEEKNAALIKRYEDYGKKYYDVFGR